MEIGQVQRIDIEQEMRSAYLDYAMSVIVTRALPDARDGLKPVQRRILYAMHELGLRHDRPHKKSARIVGEVLGKYHPHGDTAVYEAMARMAQDFSLRSPLVDGQGNFGSVDGDSPAAMRYTEARLAATAAELLADIDKDTVNWTANFDSSLQEPQVLPARLPNLLVNGSSGIAVGMATSIPPHNLAEICNALTFLIDRWEHRDEVSVHDLIRHLPGPDFPTGGVIVGEDEIAQAYATGRGQIIVRAASEIEQLAGNRQRILIDELPYQVNKSSLMERIASLVRDGRVEEIADLRDESDQRGMSIVIELKRGAQPDKVLNQLFKYTALQSTFSVQLLALVDGEPRLLTLKRALELHVEHRQEVITRRSRHELEQAQARAHVLEGLRIALDHLDAVISTIRESPDAETARGRLIERFALTEVQAQAILDMQLRRLAALERQKIEDEYHDLVERMAFLEDLLASPRRILALIRSDLVELKDTYGDARRTRITCDVKTTLDDKDLVREEEVLISITRQGYIKRVPLRTHRAQTRGQREARGIETREEDSVLYLFLANSLDDVYFFTSRGKLFTERAYQIPDAGRGTPLTNLLQLAADEQVTAALPVSGLAGDVFLTMASVGGLVKRIPLSEFAAVRSNGLIAIRLRKGDELGWARLTSGEAELILVTEKGQALRFHESDARPTNRTASGVNGIHLQEGDRVASAEVVVPEHDLLIVTGDGFGKRTPVGEFRTQRRHTKGVRCIGSRPGESSIVAAARIVGPNDEVTIISETGSVVRTAVASIPQLGRTARGTSLVELADGDRVASVAVLEGE